MKAAHITGLILTCIVLSCTQVNQGNSSVEITKLNSEIDSLNKRIINLKKDFKPGIGSIMLNIQNRHTKLGLSIKSGNWKLSNFELEEIEEDLIFLGQTYPTFDGFKESTEEYIKRYIAPAIEQLEESCTKEDSEKMKKAYNLLTAGCNSCHTETGRPFISIVEPAENTFSDQKF